MRVRVLALLPTALLLCACPAGTTTQTVYSAANALTAADELAIQYVTLPTCAAHPQPCADPAIVAQIKASAQAAHDAVKKAETAGDNASLATANAAISALQSIPAIQALSAAKTN